MAKPQNGRKYLVIYNFDRNFYSKYRENAYNPINKKTNNTIKNGQNN